MFRSQAYKGEPLTDPSAFFVSGFGEAHICIPESIIVYQFRPEGTDQNPDSPQKLKNFGLEG